MVEIYVPSIHLQHLLESYLIKPLKPDTIFQYPVDVVVAENQMDMTIENTVFKQWVECCNTPEAEVPEMVDVVILTNNRVPVIDKSEVHLLHSIPWTDTVLQDVIMPEVS